MHGSLHLRNCIDPLVADSVKKAQASSMSVTVQDIGKNVKERIMAQIQPADSNRSKCFSGDCVNDSPD